MSQQDETMPVAAVDEALSGLFERAERQQALAQAVLARMADECEEFVAERERWSSTVHGFRGEVGVAVREAVTLNIAEVMTNASSILNDLTGPVADRMAGASAKAEAAARAFEIMIGWASWRLLAWGLGALAGLVLLGWLASGVVLWWDTRAIAAAHVAKQQLQMEVAALDANRRAWIDAGMGERLERCGVRRRLCVAVDESAGAFGEGGDRRILKGF